jgi:branched-chain amino acid transport system substrate-binding protein
MKEGCEKSLVNRRNFLKSTASMAALFSLSQLGVGKGDAQEPVVFAVVDDLSGPFAASGKRTVEGMQMALEEINYSLLGRKIKLEIRDTELKPGVAVRRMREVIEKEHPKLIISSCSSAVQLAMEEVALDQKTLFWTQGWATEITGKACNRYTFRWDPGNFTMAKSAVVNMMKLVPERKKWFTITADYSWGYSMLDVMVPTLRGLGARHIGNIYTPLGEREFSTYLTAAMAAKPDVISIVNFGEDQMNAVKQAHEFGAKKMALIQTPGSGLEMFRGVGSEALEGVYSGVSWWFTVDTPFSKEFSRKYKERFKDTASFSVINHYTAVKVTIEAMKSVGSFEPGKVIPKLEGFKYTGPFGEEVVREWDHQCIHPYLLTKGKAPKDKKFDDDYVEIVGSGEAFPTNEESLCKDIFRTKL